MKNKVLRLRHRDVFDKLRKSIVVILVCLLKIIIKCLKTQDLVYRKSWLIRINTKLCETFTLTLDGSRT